MKTYQLKDGTFVGTQAEIPKGENFEVVEVPTDKPGLLAFLNNLSKPEPVTATAPKPETGMDEQYKAETAARAAKLDYTVNLEEALWAATPKECIRLGAIVMERSREILEKLNVTSNSE